MKYEESPRQRGQRPKAEAVRPRQAGTKYARQFVGAEPAQPETAASPTPAAQPDVQAPERPREDAGRETARPQDGPPQHEGGGTGAQHGTRYTRNFRQDAPPRGEAEPAHSRRDAGQREPKLRFTADEVAADTAPEPSRRTQKAGRRAEKYAGKLDAAREKLPTKRRVKYGLVKDEKTHKYKNRLHFEKEDLPNGKPPGAVKRGLAGGANAGLHQVHKKLYEVENENVGTKAAHRGELAAEGGVRKAGHVVSKRIRTAPARRVRRLEKKTAKASADHAYKKMLDAKPQLASNPISRMLYKRKLVKQYRKAQQAAKNTKRGAKAGAKGAQATYRAGRAVLGFFWRHKVLSLVLLGVALVAMLFTGVVSSCSLLGGVGANVIVAPTYTATDADIDAAELLYTEWETDLQFTIAAAETTHPGFDEYRYSVPDIGHSPYELMAWLSAVYQDFAFADVQGSLADLFNSQYALSFVEETEIRTRTEERTGTYIDPDTLEEVEYTYEVEVEYEWHILNVTLTVQPFGSLVASRLATTEQQQFYALYMQSYGNRFYVMQPFDFDWAAAVTSMYGWRVHPTTGAKDYHMGADIAAATGTPILAGLDGAVTFAGFDGTYGNIVVLEDGEGLAVKYAHCDTLLVSVGQAVEVGDTIATVGSTGQSTGPHLHMEVVRDGQNLNPLYFVYNPYRGSRQDFSGDPGAPMGDGTLAALIAEAERHLGKPYVFGASGPDVFDCSGYISYILNQSGVANVGRQTAQGLYNLCTPVSPADAQPGDLIFFQGTYSTSSTVTHVGLYVGGNTMIHCGDPISYASTSSAYWQSHFYAFGRLG